MVSHRQPRLAVNAVTEEYNFSLLSIFRDEIGGCVSRASAFLLAVLAFKNYDLDALTWSIRPARNWPFRSMASPREDQQPAQHRSAKEWTNRKLDSNMRNVGGPIFPLRDGGRARVRVMEDCLDISATIGGVGFVSTGGQLRAAVPWPVTRSVATASVFQPLSQVVDLTLLADRVWPVVAVERSSAGKGCTFVADVGQRC